jgi:hypothetical protein
MSASSKVNAGNGRFEFLENEIMDKVEHDRESNSSDAGDEFIDEFVDVVCGSIELRLGCRSF